ncbi:hypothetical protein BTA51_12590 [Hahella sp. CCB-MM4]|uniref:DUF3501 family protein n=1 Tax=Hahella sp. (strain CCB-MM4) TaxID=1926491 RepID=UPI000B9BBD4B|nr:DUF3501 family protein [Hahella sp. CCB-MM4]OZG73037.1 hypothetical protein BTA51_12590 [Hahella sp. CCB-MM4]
MQTSINKLTHEDLWSLEEYDTRRQDFRTEVMHHKKNRQVALNEHMRLYFEDRITVQYQIQEMLRIEKLFKRAEIQDELDAYNPLIPDGNNLKATFMLEYDDPAERKVELKRLRGIEKALSLKIAGYGLISAIADEDLEREDDEKTSSVHFLRFELSPEIVSAIKQGADIGFVIDHPEFHQTLEAVPENVRKSLANDLAGEVV